MNFSSHFLVKPFIKVGFINIKLLSNILKELSIIEKQNSENYLHVEKKPNRQCFSNNWLSGVTFLTSEKIKNLDNKSYGEKLKEITAESYKINPNKLTLDSGLLFEPSKCKAKLQYNKDFFLYHLFHVDSSKRYKILISIDESNGEEAQFSYIDQSKIQRNFFYYINVILPGLFIRLLSAVLRRITFNFVKLNLQPPKLNKYFQDKEKYLQFKNLKKGSFIIFNNLHPHSSHTGDYIYKSRMLQLVYK